MMLLFGLPLVTILQLRLQKRLCMMRFKSKLLIDYVISRTGNLRLATTPAIELKNLKLIDKKQKTLNYGPTDTR